MTKKRIADLLKEEVEKTNQGDQTPANSPSNVTEPTSEATSTTSQASTTTTRTNKTARTSTAKQTKLKSDNTAALKKQITELEGSLKQAREQITGLQEDIKTHQTRIFELKDELEASQKSTVETSEALAKATEELETAKQTIRQITAAQPEKNTPKQDETLPTQVVHGADLATNRNTLSLRNRPRSYKAIPEYAIQRGEQNSMLSDDDIGWVD